MLSSRQNSNNKRSSNSDCYSDKLRQQFQDSAGNQKAPSNLRKQQKLKNFQYEAEQDDLDFINEDHQWRQAAQLLNETDVDLVNELRHRQQREDEQIQDDNSSSISFAQSGCHSILSAWRFKANRLKRKNQQKQQLIQGAKAITNRPQSVLSNASTNLTRKSTTSSFKNNNRILLGHSKQQSYFVTNSQRRRRANELILHTLDARRRALNLQKNASLFGSNMYLNEDDLENLMDPVSAKQQTAYQSRLSLSPSPVALGNSQLAAGTQNKSPAGLHQRPALSDLGLSSVNTRNGNIKQPTKPKVSSSSRSNSPGTESSDEESSEHSSSGSHFTQLVTSELAPNCLDLLNDHHLANNKSNVHQPIKPTSAATKLTATLPISVPERQKEKLLHDESEKGSDLASQSGGRQFRRDVLMRDSIRRLRLSSSKSSPPQLQQQQRQQATDADESSSSSSDQQLKQLKPLPKARKMDIENNPFLRRGHFRTTSVRSAESTATRSVPTEAHHQPPQSPKPAQRPKILSPKPKLTLNQTRQKSTFEPSQSSDERRPADELDDVQLVEKMLRQMKANQVFTSYSKQKSETLFNSNERILTTLNEPTPIKASKVPSQQQKMPQPQLPQQRRKSSALQSAQSRSIKTSDTNPLDSNRTSPTRRTQRMELLDRSSNISPPLGFGDQVVEEPNYYLNREPKTRLVIVEPRSRNTTSVKKIEITKQQQPAVSRSVSVERPPVVAARRKQPQTSLLTGSQQELKPLPVFERTADDEFKKRVDYLRRLAKANLEPEDPAKKQTTKATSSVSPKQQQKQAPLTRLMSTNWSRNVEPAIIAINKGALQLASPTGSQSLFDERARWKSGPYANKDDLSPRRSPATTNLDAILADRYQLNKEQAQILNAGNRWHRSNSSLASLSSPTKGDTSRRQFATRDETNRQILNKPTSHSVPSPLADKSNLTASQQARPQPKQTDLNDSQQLAGPGLVKLVVKEKSAPRLNYAFVEQQAVQQTPTVPQRPQLLAKQQQQKQSQFQRISSPRSPEFGGTANSSNDDSAIASSVSSPSLSFMMNPPPGTSAPNFDQQQKLANQAARSASPAQRPTQLLTTRTKMIESASGNLQSILRRAHMQQMQRQTSSESSSDGQQDSQQQQQFNNNSSGQEPSNVKSSLPSQSVEPSRPMSPLREQQPVTSAETFQSPPKRVHFNDRTSIRSFESISSLASNSTAIQANDISSGRQIPQSPDSMSSSDAGRLSAESPLKNLCSSSDSAGAAIYAIRGDPELEDQASSSLINAIGLHTTAQLARNPYGQQHQQLYQHQMSQLRTQQPAQMGRLGSGPYIRMTAPPVITTAAISGQQPQYSIRPRSMGAFPSNLNQYQQQHPVEDEETMRMRQAAAQRLYQFAQQQQPNQPQIISPHFQHFQQTIVRPTNLAGPNSPGVVVATATAAQTRGQLRPSNYTTEV